MSNSAESNIIHTDRLILTPHGIEDFGDSAAMWSSAEVVRHISGTPSTNSEAWSRVLRYAGHWALLGYGYWAIREKTSCRFVGEVGFGQFKRGLGGRFDKSPECGWALMPWAQGRHFATEAVRAALEWAAAKPWMGSAVCMIHPDNKPSLSLAQRNGFREYERTTFNGSPAILFTQD